MACLQLQSLGLKQFTFSNCTMTSDRYICSREPIDGNPHVIIVDLANPSDITRFPAGADSAIMNPEQKILALKGTVAATAATLSLTHSHSLESRRHQLARSCRSSTSSSAA